MEGEDDRPVSYTHLLQDKKWIEPYGDSEGRKKEYHITAQGKEIAEKELARLNELVRVASEIIGEVQYEYCLLYTSF